MDQVTLKSVGAPQLGYPIDWLNGISVTTTKGRTFGFACLSASASAPTCTSTTSAQTSTSSPPPGYPYAVVGECSHRHDGTAPQLANARFSFATEKTFFICPSTTGLDRSFVRASVVFSKLTDQYSMYCQCFWLLLGICIATTNSAFIS